MTEDVNFDYVSKLATEPKDSYYLIDVRSFDEVKNSGKMKHTTACIPIDELEQDLKLSDEEFLEKHKVKKPPSDVRIVFSCGRGGRATKAAVLAQTLGFTQSKRYAGSFQDWEANGGQIG